MPKKRISRKNPNVTRTQVLADQLFKALNPSGSKALKKRNAKMTATDKALRKKRKK